MSNIVGQGARTIEAQLRQTPRPGSWRTLAEVASKGPLRVLAARAAAQAGSGRLNAQ